MTTPLNRILHAASATAEDRPALTYAATLARAAEAELISVHASELGDTGAAIMDANACLVEVGEPPGLPHERRFHACCDDPIDTLLDAVQEIQPDLIVMGSHTPGPLERFVFDSHAEAMAANAGVPVLVVPLNSIVQPKDAVFHLDRAVIPAADPVTAIAAIEALGWLAHATGSTAGEMVLLGVGTAPSGELEPPAGWDKSSVQDTGPVVESIAHAGRRADLIVMGTLGRDSVMDTLFGTRTERLLHRAPCPILAVPLKR